MRPLWCKRAVFCMITLSIVCATGVSVEKTGVSQYSCRDGTHGYSWMWEGEELPSCFHGIAFQIDSNQMAVTG